MPSAFGVVIRGIAPVSMNLDGAAAVMACLLVPFRSFSGLTLFVGPRRMIPVAVDSHATAADSAGFFVPGTLFVICGYI